MHCLNKVCSNYNNTSYLLEDCIEGLKLLASKSSNNTKPNNSSKSSNNTKPNNSSKSSNNTKPNNSSKSSNNTKPNNSSKSSNNTKPNNSSKSSNNTKPNKGSKSTNNTLTKPPYSMPLKPVKYCLTIKLVTVLSKKHISSISLVFNSCFKSNKS